ncbi:MAG: hypothetical protein ACRDY5_05295, partial [Acidimicrobiales bacterium]
MAEVLRRRLGPSAVERPVPSVPGVAAAAGGALLAGGLALVAYDSWSGGGRSAPSLVLTAAVLATSLLALAGPAGPLSGPVVPAAVAASGVSAPALAFFCVGAGGEFPPLRPAALLAGLALAALYLVGPAPGHSFHLTLLAAAAWLAALAGTGPGGVLLRTGTLAGAVVDAGVASLLVGLAQLAAGWWLDRAGLVGMAPPLMGVGASAAAFGGAVVWFE